MTKTAKNSLIYLSGTVVMGVLGLVSTVLLTRILPQQVYAMYGLLTSFVTAADMFVVFGYDQAYMRFYYSHNRTPLRFLWECMKVPAIIFAVLAIALLEPGQHLIKYIFENELAFIVILGITGQIFFSSISRFSQLTARMGEFAGNYVISNIIGRTGFLALLGVIALLVKELSFGHVVLTRVIMAMASVGVTGLVFRKLGNTKNPEGVPVRNRELLQYGLPLMVNNVVVLVVPVLEKVLIRDLAGWEILSIFTAASVFQTVVSMVSLTLNNIWSPIVYKHYNDHEVFKPVLHTFGLLGAIIMALGTAACILLRRWLVLLLDPRYRAVQVIAPVILLAACFNILSIIYGVGISISKKNSHYIVASVLQIITSVVMCYLLIPGLGLIGVALACLTSLGVSHFYKIAMGLKLYKTDIPEIKSFSLCGISIAAAVCSLFHTTLLSDILLAVGLVLLMLVIVNKDLLPIIHFVIAKIKTKNKE